jgi:hypothetical protein
MELGWTGARLFVFLIFPGGAILTSFLIAVSGHPLLFAVIGGAIWLALAVAVGLVFGFDATSDDITEDLMGVQPGDLDPISAREFVQRSDQEDQNFSVTDRN